MSSVIYDIIKNLNNVTNEYKFKEYLEEYSTGVTNNGNDIVIRVTSKNVYIDQYTSKYHTYNKSRFSAALSNNLLSYQTSLSSDNGNDIKIPFDITEENLFQLSTIYNLETLDTEILSELNYFYERAIKYGN